MLRYWHRLNDWLKALLIALAIIGFAQLFLVRWVTVRSASMYSTLWPGDLVGVLRWPVWTGFHRGDVAVFRDPLQDDRMMLRRTLEVKRIVGTPGDEVRLRDGDLYVNGDRTGPYVGETRSWLVRVKRGTDMNAMLERWGLPPAYQLPDGTEIELPLNADLARALREEPGVVSAEPMRTASGSPSHIFPYSPTYPWNTDDYGPIRVPMKGDTVRVDAATLPLYDRIIVHYERNTLQVKGNDITINGVSTHDYVIEQDYYFVLGDSRHYSADSRFWGFVPADHLVGRAGFVLLSSDPVSGSTRSGRWFTAVH